MRPRRRGGPLRVAHARHVRARRVRRPPPTLAAGPSLMAARRETSRPDDAAERLATRTQPSCVRPLISSFSPATSPVLSGVFMAPLILLALRTTSHRGLPQSYSPMFGASFPYAAAAPAARSACSVVLLCLPEEGELPGGESLRYRPAMAAQRPGRPPHNVARGGQPFTIMGFTVQHGRSPKSTSSPTRSACASST